MRDIKLDCGRKGGELTGDGRFVNIIADMHAQAGEQRGVGFRGGSDNAGRISLVIAAAMSVNVPAVIVPACSTMASLLASSVAIRRE